MTDRHDHQLYINDVARRAEEKIAVRLSATLPAQPDPAAQLRAAAQLLRERATAATPGPWQARGDYSDAIYSDTSEGIVDVIAGGKWGGEASVFDNEHDATWIALMHPGVGEPLAAWLETAADYYRPGAMHPTHVVRALAVARALLGSQP